MMVLHLLSVYVTIHILVTVWTVLFVVVVMCNAE